MHTETSRDACAASCFRRIAAASPAGPPPTITTSYSIASRVIDTTSAVQFARRRAHEASIIMAQSSTALSRRLARSACPGSHDRCSGFAGATWTCSATSTTPSISATWSRRGSNGSTRWRTGGVTTTAHGPVDRQCIVQFPRAARVSRPTSRCGCTWATRDARASAAITNCSRVVNAVRMAPPAWYGSIARAGVRYRCPSMSWPCCVHRTYP